MYCRRPTPELPASTDIVNRSYVFTRLSNSAAVLRGDSRTINMIDRYAGQ